MNLTHNKSAARGPTIISFPMLESWNPMTNVATIAADVSGKRVLCRISAELLKKRFRTSGDEPMKVVAENRTTIREAANKLLEKEAYEEDGSILIRARDI